MTKYSQVDAAGFTNLEARRGNPLDVLRHELGGDFDEYRRVWDKVNSFELESDFPISIDFEVSSTCNLECVMCSLGYKENNRQNLSDFKLFKKIIDESNGRLKSILLNVLGEPLLNKKIIEYIQYARNNGVIDIMINTNGILLTEEMSNKLLESGLTRLHVSVDAADKKTYKKIRGEDQYDIIRSNLKYFKAERDRRNKRMPVIRGSFVKCKENIHQIEKFKNEFDDLVDFYSIQEFYNPIPGSNKALAHRAPEKKKFSNQCNQPWNRLVVLSNGYVGPCCAFGSIPELKIGDANIETIEHIWQSDQMKFLRNIHKEGKYYKDPCCKVCLEQ